MGIRERREMEVCTRTMKLRRPEARNSEDFSSAGAIVNVNSISPPMLPAISSEEGREVVDDAVRGADERQSEESAAPNAGAEAQVDVEDEGGASAEGTRRRELPSP